MRRMSSITRHMLHVTRHTSHGTLFAPKEVGSRESLTDCSRGSVKGHVHHANGHTSHVKCHISRVTRHTSHVTRHTSHVTRHTSHVTRHTSHVTRHTSHLRVATRRKSSKHNCSAVITTQTHAHQTPPIPSSHAHLPAASMLKGTLPTYTVCDIGRYVRERGFTDE